MSLCATFAVRLYSPLTRPLQCASPHRVAGQVDCRCIALTVDCHCIVLSHSTRPSQCACIAFWVDRRSRLDGSTAAYAYHLTLRLTLHRARLGSAVLLSHASVSVVARSRVVDVKVPCHVDSKAIAIEVPFRAPPATSSRCTVSALHPSHSGWGLRGHSVVHSVCAALWSDCAALWSDCAAHRSDCKSRYETRVGRTV